MKRDGPPAAGLDPETVRSAATFVVAGCAIAIGVAIAKPQVAHLVAQAALIAVVALVAVVIAATTLGRLPPGPFATGWRPVRRARPSLPRDISALVDDLGNRGRRLSPSAVAKIVNLMVQRLELRHGLTPTRDDDLPALKRLLSPLAYQLVTARRGSYTTRTHPYEQVELAAFDPLMTELETL